MQGVDASTGRPSEGRTHLRQSIRDILTTPLGSRVMRRTYGSRLFELVDHPLNAETIAAMVAATAEAIDRWEPRYRITRILVGAATSGHVTIDLEGVYVPEGVPLSVSGVVV